MQRLSYHEYKTCKNLRSFFFKIFIGGKTLFKITHPKIKKPDSFLPI